MNTPIVHLPIDSITVGDRLRDDMGDIAALAESIREHGLLHPITVDEEGVLIAGGRRLAAMRKLGFETVPARHWQTLDENDRRLIELEENLQRKDLTHFERSKNTVELHEVAATVDVETGEIVESGCAESAQPDRPQNRPKLGSLRRVSERIGIPESTIRAARKHVAAAEKYPALQKPEWPQYRAMEAAAELDKLPDEERADIESVLNEPGVPPDTAITILKTWQHKPQEERETIRRGLNSDDGRDRSAAKAALVNEPPPPNTMVLMLESVKAKQMKEAVRRMRGHLKTYPNDPETPALERLIDAQIRVMESIDGLVQAIETQEKNHVEATA